MRRRVMNCMLLTSSAWDKPISCFDCNVHRLTENQLTPCSTAW